MPESIEVLGLDQNLSTWEISTRLGTLKRPLNPNHEDKRAIAALKLNGELLDELLTMIWEETSQMASISAKDGEFGILFERLFDCAEAFSEVRRTVAPRARVIRRTLCDIRSEIKARKLDLEGVYFGIPDHTFVPEGKVALWAFIPHSKLVSTFYDYDFIDDLVTLITECA